MGTQAYPPCGPSYSPKSPRSEDLIVKPLSKGSGSHLWDFQIGTSIILICQNPSIGNKCLKHPSTLLGTSMKSKYFQSCLTSDPNRVVILKLLIHCASMGGGCLYSVQCWSMIWLTSNYTLGKQQQQKTER